MGNVTKDRKLKYLKEVNGRLYFRKVFTLGKRRVTVHHRVSQIDDPAFLPEYMALLSKYAVDKVAPEVNTRPTKDGDDLYVIQVGRNGHVKIGRSKDPHARMKAIQTSQGKDVRLLVRAAGMGHAERDIHRAFASSRIRGEWFKWDAYTKKLVVMLRAGTDWRRAAPSALKAARVAVGAPDPEQAAIDAWEAA